MGNAYSTYKKAMLDVWQGWWITWPLSTRVDVGSIYDTTGDALRTAGTLAAEEIPYRVSSGTPSDDFTYDSNGSAVVRFKPAGSSAEGFESLATADAGALVEFRKDSSILVVYRDLNQRGISDARDVAAELVHRYWQGRWSEELVAVTDVIFVERGTVLAAAGSGALIELRLSASVGTGPMTVADISATVSVGRKQQIGFQWLGGKLTPFFRVVRLRKSWLGQVKKDYGPRQRGPAALPIPLPELLLEEARESPSTVIETIPDAEQVPFPDITV